MPECVIPALSLAGHRSHDRVGRRALRHGGQADRMPGRTGRRRPRSSDRLRPRRPGLRNGLGNDDSSGDGDDMTTATDVIALETDHLLQVYRRGRVVFERGTRLPPVRRRRARVSGPDFRGRRRVARPCESRGWPRRSRHRPASCCTRRTSTSTRSRASWRRGWPRCRGCRARSSATAARKPSRRASSSPASSGMRRRVLHGAAGSLRSSTRSTAARWARFR